MADLDFENIDTIKAFATILLGSALGWFLFWLYFTTIRPHVVSLGTVSTAAAAPSTTSAAAA